MKYGKLSHGNVDVDQVKNIKVAEGDSISRPDDPKTGDIRYNHDREAVGIGANSGFGQYEVYQNGEWNTLLTEMDFTDSRDVKDKETVSDNIIFKMIAESLKDTFVTAIGSISLLQESRYGFGMGWYNTSDAYRQSYFPGTVRNYPSADVSNMEEFNDEQALPVYLSNVQKSGGGRATSMIESTQSGNNLVGAFKPFIGRGRVYDVVVEDPGLGYDQSEPPQLLLDTRGGKGAVLKATMVSGVVTSVVVISPGSGYRSDKVMVYEKGARARRFARYRINTSDDGNNTSTKKIDSVTVLDGGSNYEKVPQVHVADGGHSAIVEPVMGPDGPDEGKIEDVRIISSGWDFTVTPDVVIKSNKTPTRPAKLKCIIGEDQMLAIKLMKPIPSNYIENGTVPLIITGGNPDVPAEAEMVIRNGVGTGVTLLNTGKNYDSDPTITLPEWFREPTTDVSITGGGVANLFVSFDFNIFQACGVPTVNKSKYNISLLTNLNGTIPMMNPYNGATIRMMVRFIPKWEPFNNYSHADYGEYRCDIQLYGQKHYYASAVSAAWRAEVTKTR